MDPSQNVGLAQWTRLNAWLARLRRKTPNSHQQFMNASITAENESHLHDSVHIGTVKRERPRYTITCPFAGLGLGLGFSQNDQDTISKGYVQYPNRGQG